MSSPFLIPSLMFSWTCNIGYHNEGSKIVKIFEYNRSFHYDDTTHHFVTDAFSSCLYHRYTIPKIQTTSLFVKYKHIRNKSKMCLTRITPTYQIELLIPLSRCIMASFGFMKGEGYRHDNVVDAVPTSSPKLPP